MLRFRAFVSYRTCLNVFSMSQALKPRVHSCRNLMRPIGRKYRHLKIFSFWLIQVLDESKLQQVDSLYKEFETPEKANKV